MPLQSKPVMSSRDPPPVFFFNTVPILCFFPHVQVVSSVPGSLAVFLIPHTNASLKQAAKDWCAGGERKEAVKRRFGPIEEWEVSEVTDMFELFYLEDEFNENISNWDVSNVKDMREAFSGAWSFNQTLSGAWSTSTADQELMFSNCPGTILTVLVTKTRAPTETRTRTHTHQSNPPNTTNGTE